ncbi:MAG: hypothetical protein KME40_32110 [Komarekiella atlantica HA4396-MV6]|jgi:hypothetical protein|nr:hypothetical protein [Komarekiella atlantica HA4396-MV6]
MDKAKRATIQIAGIEVEVFQLPDGEYVMSQTQVAGAVGKPEWSIRDFLSSKQSKTLLGKNYRLGKNSIPVDHETCRGSTRIQILPIGLASAYWLNQAFKGNVKAESLAYACMKEALERRCDKAFQQQKAEQEYEEQAVISRQTWEQSRGFLRDAHSSLVNCCLAWGFDGARTHNEITLAVCGKTAKELREMEVIEGNPKVGLNHIQDKEVLVKIARVKIEFSRYRSGTMKQRVTRAVEAIN